MSEAQQTTPIPNHLEITATPRQPGGAMDRSDSLDKFLVSFVKAQGDFPDAKANKNNPYFNSKYADLNEIFKVCKKYLNENGISILQPIAMNGDVTIETYLMHTSGQFISSSVSFKPSAKVQSIASDITYFRRYSLQSILGISVDGEDDDGNEANGNAKSSPPQKTTTRTSVRHDKPDLRTKPPDPTKAPAPSTAPAPKTAYDCKNNSHQEYLFKILAARGIQADLWDRVNNEMDGKNRDDIVKVITDVLHAVGKEKLF